jgi:hypothetical protein
VTILRVTLGLLTLVSLATVPAVNAATGGNAQQLAVIERETQSIRGLRQLHPVKAIFPSNAGFNKALNAENRRDNPPAVLDLGKRESVELGELPPGANLRRILFQGLSAQVAGFYDYRRHILYVRAGSQAFSPAWRWTIAHEYTHALQDQHYNLGKLLPDNSASTYKNSDAIGARHALTEGDAVTTQTLFIYKTYSKADMQALDIAQAHLPKTPPVPRSIERGFNFPYTTGVNFVTKLYTTGGMAAIDAAYRRLPASTYEIMHPNAYLKHWAPATVTMHGVGGLSGWKQMDDDVQGCFGYDLLLWQYLPRTRADAVTNAYRGDRYIFLEHGNQNAMLLRSLWTTPAAAQTALQAFQRALKVRFGPSLHPAGASTFSDAAGGVYLSASGTALTMAYAPSAAVARQLGTAPIR